MVEKKGRFDLTWFSNAPACCSFHISSSMAALYSAVSLGSGGGAGAAGGGMELLALVVCEWACLKKNVKGEE